jgi:hypothetical protein
MKDGPLADMKQRGSKMAAAVATQGGIGTRTNIERACSYQQSLKKPAVQFALRKWAGQCRVLKGGFLGESVEGSNWDFSGPMER